MSASFRSTTFARRPTASARGILVAVYAAANWTKRLVRGWLNRRTALQMMHFDEHMLKDIGLTRGDVHAAIVEPMGTDPTVRMRILAVERRAANRALAAERLAALRAEEAARGIERRRLRLVDEDCTA